MKDKINYHFKLENETEYNLIFNMEAQNKVMHMLFNNSILKLQKKGQVKGNMDVDKLDKITTFKIEPKFYNFLKTTIKKYYNNVFNEVKKDGIELMDYHVKDAVFKRKGTNKDKWNITIICYGKYINKRGILK